MTDGTREWISAAALVVGAWAVFWSLNRLGWDDAAAAISAGIGGIIAERGTKQLLRKREKKS
jgi:hypothetical protein